MKNPLKVMCRFIVLFVAGSCFAVTSSDDAWHFDVAPYLWAIQMHGRVQVASKAAHVDESFSDIMKQLNWGGMIWLEANKAKLGLFVNSLYAVLSDDAHAGPYSVNSKMHFGIFSAGASYDVYRYCFSNVSRSSISLAPYAGARYTLNHVTIQFNAPAFSDQASNNQNWTDPIVGMRLHYTINRAWQIILAGDVGGRNTSTQYSYNATGVLGYSPQTVLTNTTVYLGYRLLDQHYTTGAGKTLYDWNMKLYGPLLGVMITF